jgi:collagen type I alpha
VSGEAQSVRWIGWRSLDCRRYAEPSRVWPVCVKAGAIAEATPARDLWLSPGHGIFIDGVIVQAEKLINGVTIVQSACERVDYWHVELERHDIIYAEGLAAESYLDTGNRTGFINGGAFIEAYPDFRPNTGPTPACRWSRRVRRCCPPERRFWHVRERSDFPPRTSRMCIC